MLRRVPLIAAAILITAVVVAACVPREEPLEGRAGEGQQLARGLGCISCHSIDGARRAGPTFQDLYGSRVDLEDGRTVTADEDYLRTAISDPEATTVRGYPRGMMARAVPAGSLRDDQVDALIAYIRTLTSE